jgi:hypothetical protein
MTVLITLILTNNELLIRIEDIYTITSHIYKSIESAYSNSIIDFRLNSRSVDVTYYTPLESIILRIKKIK